MSQPSHASPYINPPCLQPTSSIPHQVQIRQSSLTFFRFFSHRHFVEHMECIPPPAAANPTSSEASSSKAKKKSAKKSKGSGVKLSTDPQSVAARERRHRISDRFKILQSMVPGGSKMDTVSMLEEAIHYVKFLKTQIWLHQTMINSVDIDDHLSFPNYEQLPPIPQNPSSVENLTQMPLDHYCSSFQDEVASTFDADMKYWPA